METVSQPILAQLADPVDFDGWRDQARRFAADDIPSEAIVWQVGDHPSDLFATAGPTPPAQAAVFPVPRAFIDLAQSVICHRDPERFALLYAVLLRLKRDCHALEDKSDPLVHRLEGLAKAVRRDIHKMRAFVRFRKTEDIGDWYVAWFEPEHHIVRANAGFFVRRFTNMNWSILTPEMSVYWDGVVLREGPGGVAADAPQSDAVEAQWKAYYASIFNPARLH